MGFDRRSLERENESAVSDSTARAPGKRTLVEMLPAPVQAKMSRPGSSVPASGAGSSNDVPRPSLDAMFGAKAPQTQRRAATAAEGDGAAGREAPGVHAAAARGISTSASELPHAAAIQQSFGRHDISSIRAHVGADASASARDMGADAYAAGNHVVLGAAADKFTVAHEAAHVVQQRAGIHLKGGVGEAGDPHEQHADEVASLVAQGQSAEGLLDRYAGASGPSGGNSSTPARGTASEPAAAAPPVQRMLRRGARHVPWGRPLSNPSSALGASRLLRPLSSTAAGRSPQGIGGGSQGGDRRGPPPGGLAPLTIGPTFGRGSQVGNGLPGSIDGDRARGEDAFGELEGEEAEQEISASEEAADNEHDVDTARVNTSDHRPPKPRISAPVPGLYKGVDPLAKVEDWKVIDSKEQTRARTSIRTEVQTPDGKSGWVERKYDPKSQTLVMSNAFLAELPKWVKSSGPGFDADKGIPTVHYLTIRQMRELGIGEGALKHVKMSTIQNVRAVIEFNALLATGIEADAAVMRTHSVQYADTTIVQSGSQVTRAKVGGDIWKTKLSKMLSHFETDGGARAADPAKVKEHDDLIASFGKGVITRDTVVQWNFDIELDVVPFGTEKTEKSDEAEK